MTFMNKLLTYLGFCPSKESAQDFRVRNNTITLKQGVVGVGFSLIFILLVYASNIYTSALTVDTILRLFSLTVFSLILAIVMVGGLIVIAREFEHDTWALAILGTFIGTFGWVSICGATTGFFFISPTDGWVEIIAEALALSLMMTAVEVIGIGAYLRWRREAERTKGEEV